ncbi:hypothetical protein LTR53_020022, partial [Teratosphaeriaceae sp. CCFEE 6253]
MISASTNRAILQPTAANRERRKSRIQNMKAGVHQHDDPAKHRGSSSSGDGSSSTAALRTGKEKLSHVPVLGTLLRRASSDSAKSHSSQLVDLI